MFLQGFDPGELEGEESDDSDDEGKYLPTLNKFVIAMVTNPRCFLVSMAIILHCTY